MLISVWNCWIFRLNLRSNTAGCVHVWVWMSVEYTHFTNRIEMRVFNLSDIFTQSPMKWRWRRWCDRCMYFGASYTCRHSLEYLMRIKHTFEIMYRRANNNLGITSPESGCGLTWLRGAAGWTREWCLMLSHLHQPLCSCDARLRDKWQRNNRFVGGKWGCNAGWWIFHQSKWKSQNKLWDRRKWFELKTPSNSNLMTFEIELLHQSLLFPFFLL